MNKAKTIPYYVIPERGKLHVFNLQNVSVSEVRSLFGKINGIIINAINKEVAKQIAEKELFN